MKTGTEYKVIIQGYTEKITPIYTAKMLESGTNIVGSVGSNHQINENIPLFDLVEQAIAKHKKIDSSIIFSPPYQVLDAALEAIASGIKQIIIVTRHIPPLDMVKLLRTAEINETLLLGPGSAGIIIPEKLLLGTYETQFYSAGNVGIISRSIGLNYEVAKTLTQVGLGQSICVNLGNGSLIGSSFSQWVEILAADKNTKVIVLIGQNGSGDEDKVAAIVEKINKPIIAYIAGINAPAKTKLGDPHAMISAYFATQMNDFGTSQRKINILNQAKIPIADTIDQIPELVVEIINKTQTIKKG
jgi:succinyl-CoA synthetase alpha subunit